MGTPVRSLRTDTLLRVCAWCLSPSEPVQAPLRTTELVPEYVETARREQGVERGPLPLVYSEDLLHSVVEPLLSQRRGLH
jgi:hypothetical protein